MKQTILFFLFTFSFIMLRSENKIILSANGKTMTATLTDNSATEELIKLLPFSVDMSPYGGFEVVGHLPQSLPTSNSQISTVPGDIMLYQGNQLVIFYGNNSWSYTRIGKINDATAEQIKDFLGSGNVTITLSNVEAGLNDIKIKDTDRKNIFDVTGKKLNSLIKKNAVYVIEGKKYYIK